MPSLYNTTTQQNINCKIISPDLNRETKKVKIGFENSGDFNIAKSWNYDETQIVNNLQTYQTTGFEGYNESLLQLTYSL
jgi:hypothetical protein